jgi:tryptophan-rich sensory protein
MNIYIYFIPLISVYLCSLISPVTKDAGKDISFRPPPYVFAIVWPILLLLLGYSWSLRQDISYLYIILTILLSVWTLLFNLSKKIALFEIIITLLLSIFLLFYKFNKVSSCLIIPLIVWLLYASILNYYSYKN